MSEQFTLKAQARQDIGKGASRRLRREADLVPAVIYGANKPAENLSLIHKDIMKYSDLEAFFSSIITVEIDGKAEKAIVKDLQRHPNKARILHLDLLRVSAKDKLTMNVPLHFLNEETAAGVKEGGVLTKHMNELEVKCLPSALPESIDIDIAAMGMDEALHITDITLPKGVELAHSVDDDAHDHIVASIAEPHLQAEPEDDAEVVAGDVPSGQKDDAADEANDAAKAKADA